MRKSSFALVAAAGAAVGLLGLSAANAVTLNSAAGLRAASEAMDTSALVHCRPYRHWHEWEHRRTYGCHGGGSVEIRRGHRVGGVEFRHGHRVGIEERESSRTSVHSRTTTRGETSVHGSTSTRTGERTKSTTSTSKGGDMKSGESKSGESKSGESKSGGGSTGRGQSGAKSSGGSSSGNSGSSGTSGTQSGSQKQ